MGASSRGSARAETPQGPASTKQTNILCPSLGRFAPFELEDQTDEIGRECQFQESGYLGNPGSSRRGHAPAEPIPNQMKYQHTASPSMINNFVQVNCGTKG